jgi:hypothetical protein
MDFEDAARKIAAAQAQIDHPNSTPTQRAAAQAAQQRIKDAFAVGRGGVSFDSAAAARAARANANAASRATPTNGARPGSAGGAISGLGRAAGIANAVMAALDVPSNFSRGYNYGPTASSGAWYDNPAWRAIDGLKEAVTPLTFRGAIGNALANGLAGRLIPNSGQPQRNNNAGPLQDYPGGQNEPAPFTGGQSENINYTIQFRRINNGKPTSSATVTLPGPIRLVGSGTTFNEPTPYTILGTPGNFYTILQPSGSIAGQNSNCEGIGYGTFSPGRIFALGCIGWNPGDPERQTSIEIMSIQRTDGQPDTGGNLPFGSIPVPAFAPTTVPNSSPIPASSPSGLPATQPSANAVNTGSPASPVASSGAAPNPFEGTDEPIPSRNPDAGRLEFNDFSTPRIFDYAPYAINLIRPLNRLTTEPATTAPSQTTRVPAGCNPACSIPGINAINDAAESILDNLKDNASSLIGLAGLGGLIQQIANAIGVDAFPISVPSSINNCDVRPGRDINNLAESQLWQVEQLDSVMGQWCNTIDVDTPNGIKQVEVNDLSDAISEILGMLAAMSINSGITQNAVIRNLIETGAVKQQAYLGHQYAKGNAEFLGYPGERKKINMPMTFTPGKGLLEGLLGQGNVPVQGWQKTDNRDLGDVMNELLQAAAIIRAVYWRRLDPKGDMQGQLKDIITRQAEFPDLDRQRQDLQSEENPDQDDWIQYLQAVENAFDESEPSPFGRDFSQRPKLTNKKPPEGLG